jgi:hypothetical protein
MGFARAIALLSVMPRLPGEQPRGVPSVRNSGASFQLAGLTARPRRLRHYPEARRGFPHFRVLNRQSSRLSTGKRVGR